MFWGTDINRNGASRDDWQGMLGVFELNWHCYIPLRVAQWEVVGLHMWVAGGSLASSWVQPKCNTKDRWRHIDRNIDSCIFKWKKFYINNSINRPSTGRLNIKFISTKTMYNQTYPMTTKFMFLLVRITVSFTMCRVLTQKSFTGFLRHIFHNTSKLNPISCDEQSHRCMKYKINVW